MGPAYTTGKLQAMEDLTLGLRMLQSDSFNSNICTNIYTIIIQYMYISKILPHIKYENA